MMRTMLIAFWWHRSTNAQQAAEKFRQRTHYRRLYSIISVRPSSSIVVPFLFYFCRAAGRKCLTDLRWEKKGFKRRVEGGEVPPSFMWTAKTTKTHWTSECCLQLEFRITQGPQNTTFLFSSVFSTASTAFQWPFFFSSFLYTQLPFLLILFLSRRLFPALAHCTLRRDDSVLTQVVTDIATVERKAIYGKAAMGVCVYMAPLLVTTCQCLFSFMRWKHLSFSIGRGELVEISLQVFSRTRTR